MPPSISEEKSLQIAEMIENQIRDDVKHYSAIGESALAGFREKVSLYNTYFTKFLYENHKDISRMDLVVQPFSLLSNVGENVVTYNDEDASPQEKIRRQKKRGSIFGQNTDSFKQSPTSPNSKTKAFNFKESVIRGKLKDRPAYPSSHTPMHFRKYQNLESKMDLGEGLRLANPEKKNAFKNSWEYFYILGQNDLQESQKKLDDLKKTLRPAGEGLDEERRVFLQMVKKNEVENVRKLLEERQKIEKICLKNKKLVNAVDVYVKMIINFAYIKDFYR
jgi:hypothetical protein